ncbi:MAG: M3 family oligoendopeptidase [Alphaproteobacteria bacterium]|nr:M3 family oligoendopeptidase [Alphaproteobacteria bacterium]MBF0128368.1 M3 family oligoendopeptidase [Alphaproteobacteria bacterium]
MTPIIQETRSLPHWFLDDLYPGFDSPELKRDLERIEGDAKAFSDAYQGRLKELDGGAFADAIAAYERLSEGMGRIESYADLAFSTRITDPEAGRFNQSMRERINAISAGTLFFTLEINRLDEEVLESKLSDPKAARYRPWLRDVRVFRTHQFSDEVERILHEREVVGRAAWVRLFDETLAGLRFDVDGESLTESETLNLLSDPSTDKRRSAAKALGKVLGDNIRVFSRITNTLVKEKEIDDGGRGYPRPISFRNLANQVEDEVVDALARAVKEAFPKLSHRYYALKASWLGVERLDYWDRNAPLPEDGGKRYGWEEARDVVLGAYEAFSPELGAIGRRFFENPWIDAEPRPGKASGAFAHSTVPSAHPYLLLNFHGRGRDVMTLAHELGHGVHQILAAGQGYLMSGSPLTLAETASVFGEMLTFRAIIDAETDPRTRRTLLASKVEDMLNTVVRQIAFHEFERAVHDERRQGELSPDRLGDIWMRVQSESLGPAFRFDEEYRNYWAYIPHFVHSPFYVYAYAFGDCLVNSLYAQYRGGASGFQDRYLDMLRAGGTLRHKDLLAPFGLDASDPAFWRQGLEIVSGLIDELEG